MPILFLIAAATALGSFWLMWADLGRRDAALAVRRLATPAPQVAGARSRPRLIEVAGEVRGRFAARLLERFKLQEGAAQLLETAGLKWGPSGLLHRSIAVFLGAFAVV